MVSKKAVSALIFWASAQILMPAYAGNEFPPVPPAKNDYITCEIPPCTQGAAMAWSRKNPYGVAISVRMGRKAAVTDDQIKRVLTDGFKHYGVEQIKFFFENYNGVSSSIGLHVKGGAGGGYGIDNVREDVERKASYALNRNPLFLPSN